jgi:hypothetical protein
MVGTGKYELLIFSVVRNAVPAVFAQLTIFRMRKGREGKGREGKGGKKREEGRKDIKEGYQGRKEGRISRKEQGNEQVVMTW